MAAVEEVTKVSTINVKVLVSAIGYTMFCIGIVIYIIGVALAYISVYGGANLSFFMIVFWVLFGGACFFVLIGGIVGIVSLGCLYHERHFLKERRFLWVMGIIGWIGVIVSLILLVFGLAGQLWGQSIVWSLFIFIIFLGTGIIWIVYIFVKK